MLLNGHWKKLLALAVLVAAVAPALASAGAATRPYAVPMGDDYALTPLLSAGDAVPETSHPSQRYQMVGIPDGLGLTKWKYDTFILYMNHELTNTTTSQPVAGGPMYRGAFVSKWILDEDGNVLSGERAYDTVYNENTLVGPAAQADNDTPAFGRFCSASLSTYRDGLDRPIFFTNEETDGSDNFGGSGGQTVAIFDNEAHILPKLGRFSKENTVLMPSTGNQTVIISLEDGPTGPDSQLYMYVGTKNRSPGASVLARNGLDNGRLYVFVSTTLGMNSETSFREGAIDGRWALISDAGHLTAAELEAAADAAGAFGFVRIEDGAFSKTTRNDFFFVTTGGNRDAGNELGRLYHLHLDPVNPTRASHLEVVYNADEVIAAGGDTAISPDNVDTSRGYLMINEDGTTQSRLVMGQHHRDGSIWRFDLASSFDGAGVDASSAKRVAQLNPPGRDGAAVGPGVWETSGIIDTSGMFGTDSWLVVVQAHSPTVAPAPGTVEDGQLLLMRPDDWPH